MSTVTHAKQEVSKAGRYLEKLRNFGIMAHIDAGKTTISERVLYYSGRTHKVGEVHDGAATMDYLEEEKERGITITSAATHCEWKGFKMNLIDTPGHVDFTAEVERSLRVLDGAVAVFDAVSGVEAQSETVWRQANKHHVPRLAFINKMDRIGADFYSALDSIRERLGARTAVIQTPMGTGKDFVGMIDIVRQLAINFEAGTDGKEFEEGPIPEEYQEQAKVDRQTLLELVAEFDEALLEKVVEEEPCTEAEIKAALRAGTLANSIIPILCGTALKNKGVQHMLDAIIDYLPCPLDKAAVKGTNPDTGEVESRADDPDAPFAALAFKTISEKTGDLTFIRVYSGTIDTGTTVYNSTRRKAERIGRLYRMHAGNREQIDSVKAGDIAACVGMKVSVTGDTLCDERKPIVLESIEFPEPVISMSIEPSTRGDRDKLGTCLSKLAKEDPTFTYFTDPETNETVIAGMGELHLEVLRNRIVREYKVEAEVGAPRVAYRQTLKRLVELEARHVKQSGGSGQFAVVKMRFEPIEGSGDIEFVNEVKGGNVPKEYIPSVERGMRRIAEVGGADKFVFVGFRGVLYDGKYHDVDSSDMAFETAGRLAFNMASTRDNCQLLEPIMKVEVQTPEEYLGDVIGDLNSRRARISDIDSRAGLKVIHGEVPIAEMFAYSSRLRSISQGRGTYSMEPQGYMPVPAETAKMVYEEAAARRAAAKK